MKTTSDMAMMYPMIEMAGINRIRYINKILYVYNTQNPLNDHKKNVSYQLIIREFIKNKKEYNEI